MGGSDDPSNLIELSVEEHAQAHKELYEKYNLMEDKMAWMGLSGQATKKELVLAGRKLGRRKTDSLLEKKYGKEWRSILSNIAISKLKEKRKNDKNFNEMMLKVFRENVKKASDASLSLKSREKRKQTLSNNNHQKGTKNSNYGKIWIYNPNLKMSKPHPKEKEIPEGWFIGRKLKW